MKNDSMWGVHLSPSLPIVSMIRPSMNSTMISARLRTPLGATSGSLRAASTKIVVPMIVAAQAISAILLKVGNRSTHRTTSLISGNSSPSTEAVL